MRASADGYENYEQNIEIKADYQKVNINLKKIEESKSTTQKTTTASTAASTETSGARTEENTTIVSTKNRVYIDGPTGAIIYFDDSYLGVAPLDFAMVTGQHTFIVVSGTTVKSYTVNLVEGADDVRYDFTNKTSN